MDNKMQELLKISKSLKILYVEDNEEARVSTTSLLERFFDEITVAIDGKDGLEKYNSYYEKTQGYYDLVISDINMPNMNGIDMSKSIMDINNKQHIVIISAYNDSKNLQKCIDIGITNYIHKPIKLSLLINTFDKTSQSINKQIQLDKNYTKIAKLNHELDALVNSFDTYVVASRTDLKGIITYASKAYQSVSGYSWDELIGTQHNIVRHPDTPQATFEDLWKTIKSGKLWTGEIKNLKKDGSCYWVNAFIAPYFDKNGNHIGYSAIRVVITAQKEVEKLNSQVNDLLNSAGEGFLSFDKYLKCESSFSKECLNIFELENLEGLDISKLLFSENSKRKELFYEGINRIIESEDEMSKELFLSLLPTEQVIGKKSIKITYKILQNDRFMIILNDITKTKELQHKLKQKNQIQKMIVEIASNKNDFLQLKDEFENFISNPPSNRQTLLRELHTFKGIFAQKEMLYITNGIHNLETKTEQEAHDDLLRIFHRFGLEEIFDKDLQVIESILSKDFLCESKILSINSKSIKEIELKIKSLLDDLTADKKHKLNEILSDLAKLKNEPLKKLLNPYQTQVKNMAAKLEKYIYPLEIQGDENLAISPKLKPFLKSLVHLFNNCIEHGIEDMEKRVEHEKDEIGTIKCSFEQISNVLVLEIGDDGGGINVNKLTQSAIKKGLYTKQECEKMSEDEKLQLIFADTLSTKDYVSHTSGRGVGMSALKENLQILNGELHIENSPKKGVTFKFTIPLEVQSYHDKSNDIQDEQVIFNSLINQTKILVEDSKDIKVLGEKFIDDLNIDQHCAQINFINNFNGCYIVALSDEIKKIIGSSFIPIGFPKQERDEMMKELPNEIANTVAGLALSDFPKHLGDTNISPPIELNNSECEKCIKEAKCKLIKEIDTTHGKISTVLIKNDVECKFENFASKENLAEML